MNLNEYHKRCPYCQKEFEAKHLSRSYCSERCKRRMFRSKQQEKRKATKTENELYLSNDKIVAKLYRSDLKPIEEKDLNNAGYNSSYLKDRLVHNKSLLITYETHYLEIFNDGKIIIHKKL